MVVSQVQLLNLKVLNQFLLNGSFKNGVASSIFGQIWSFFALITCIGYKYEEYQGVDG